MQKLRAHLSYANVVATLALVVAVAGGTTAVAGPGKAPKNSVTSSSIRNGSVTAKDLARITMVEAVGNRPGGAAAASCPKGQRLIGGGGGGGLLAASEPSNRRGSERTAEEWMVAATPPSRATALCLAAKPSRQKD